ncbi:hypothetical protein BDZ94DRAFT_1266172 [Collybia nuda]|uniref:Uncharacterized protein n=1 Tax=Collybia nuda TaxID=64659 RepID=A0A9P5Y161_9AGAR|nr:hypothetical protein BDZ94DRAFT_1266172 [Collybia nuda]
MYINTRYLELPIPFHTTPPLAHGRGTTINICFGEYIPFIIGFFFFYLASAVPICVCVVVGIGILL